MSTQVYTGIWTDHSLPSGRGLTLTLSARDGAILLAFISAFVTIAAGQLWTIVCFSLHQALVSAPHRYRDALYFQRQNILRNSATPYGAAWSFVLQARTWSGRADKAKTRTLGWAFGAWAYALAFAAAAVLSSQISRGASSMRLLQSVEGCGYWVADDPDLRLRALGLKLSADIRSAVAYARACYGEDNDYTAKLECRDLPQPRLEYTFTSENVSCPFGEDICWRDFVVRMQTNLLDSREDFGINAPDHERVQFRQLAVCTALVTEGYERTATEEDLETLPNLEANWTVYDYGSRNNMEPPWPYTHYYNPTAMRTDKSYSTPADLSLSNNTGEGWMPKPELRSETADTSIIMVEFNGVTFHQRSVDPIFFVTTKMGGSGTEVFWRSDYFVSPLACAEQLQMCNPNNGKCTAWLGRGNDQVAAWAPFDFNPAQEIALKRILDAANMATIFHMVHLRPFNSLRAQDTMYMNQQMSLKPNQWHFEVRAWFEESLAYMQQKVQGYAIGPEINRGSVLLQDWKNVSIDQEYREASKAGCENQRISNAQGTISFSVLGMAILFAIGGLIILLSMSLESIAACARGIFKTGSYRKLAWDSDANLGTQRMLLQARGFGDWDDKTSHDEAAPLPAQTFPATALLGKGELEQYSSLENSQQQYVLQPSPGMKNPYGPNGNTYVHVSPA